MGAPQPLEDLHIRGGDLAKALPRPQLFPNLRTLCSDGYLEWHPPWLRQLGQLRRLEQLMVQGVWVAAGVRCMASLP